MICDITNILEAIIGLIGNFQQFEVNAQLLH